MSRAVKRRNILINAGNSRGEGGGVERWGGGGGGGGGEGKAG